jgi:hypothetical protein
MYNPDLNQSDGTDISISPDRKEHIVKLVNNLHDKLGYGVTRIGDRLTIRRDDYDIELVILSVNLARDYENP